MIRVSRLAWLTPVLVGTLSAGCAGSKSVPTRTEPVVTTAPSAPAARPTESPAPAPMDHAASGPVITTATSSVPTAGVPTFATLGNHHVDRAMSGPGESAARPVADVSHGTQFPPATPRPNPNVVGAGLSSYSDDAFDIVGPATDEKISRFDAMKQLRQANARFRNIDPRQLNEALNQVSPNAEAIKAVLRTRSNNKVIKYLSTFLTDGDANRVASTSALLLADVFADPDYTSSKLAEVVLDLGAISKRGYYDEIVAGRVAFLQGQIDQSLKHDRIGGYLRDSLLIAAPVGLAYVVAGRQARVLDKSTNLVRSVRVGAILSDGRSTLKSSYASARGAFARANVGVENTLKKLDLSPKQAVHQELNAIGLSTTELNALGFERIPKSQLNYLAGSDKAPGTYKIAYRPTDRRRLDYAIVDHYDDVIPDNKVMVLLKLKRRLRREQVVGSKHMTIEEATALTKRLEPSGQNEFLTAVDALGAETQTLIRTEKMADADGAAIKSPRAVRVDSTEPATMVAAEPTPAPRAVRMGPTAEAPAGAFPARPPVSEVEAPPAFDHLRGAIAAVTTGSIISGATVLGYLEGERNGRDFENTNLEGQVDRLARPAETAVSDLKSR